MKKKGLIVATIVMVLVLAVSLTTATYAWFTTDSKATISSISIATTSASDVQVGLRANRTDLWSGAPNAAQFKSGTVGFNGLVVTDGQDTVGASVITGIQLSNLTKAIGTATKTGDSEPYTYDIDDTTFNLGSGHVLIAANGTLTAADNNTVKEAEANRKPGAGESDPDVPGDYVDWVIGFMPTKETIDTVTFNVTVKPGAKVTLGLLAALHLRYSWDGTTYYDVDLYGTDVDSDHKSNHQTTLKTAVTTTGLPSTSSASFTSLNGGTIALNATTTITNTAAALNTLIANINDTTSYPAGTLNYAITIGTSGVSLGANLINQMHFQLYYAGYDSDCVNDGLGADATIYFTITNTNGYTPPTTP